MRFPGLAGWWRRRRHKPLPVNAPHAGPVCRQAGPAATSFRAISRAEDDSRVWPESFLPLPNDTPFEMLLVYRFLRDHIPDVSDAVWTWKRLCHTGYTLEVEDNGRDHARALAAAAALEDRVNASDGGMSGLLDIFYTSLFTYGAAAFEIVPGEAREWIHDIVPVDVWTVRFRRDNGRLRAYQIQDGAPVRLSNAHFFYVGLDRDGTNPYGRSLLRSLPQALAIQQQLLSDMARATRNAGWSKLHVRYTPEERPPGESPEEYQARMAAHLHTLRDRLSGAAADQNLVTFDNVEVALVGGTLQGASFYDNHKAVEEQVITGMHMMPVLMGRNYGSTETYGTAQFEVVNRQVITVNRRVAALLNRIYNLEFALRGLDVRARARLRGNRTVDVLKEAVARGREIDNALRLMEAGLIVRDEARALLRRDLVL